MLATINMDICESGYGTHFDVGCDVSDSTTSESNYIDKPVRDSSNSSDSSYSSDSSNSSYSSDSSNSSFDVDLSDSVYYTSKLSDYGGMTCLHFAVMKKNNEDCIKFLLEQGADAEILNNDNQSVLHIMALYGNYSYLKIFAKTCKLTKTYLFACDTYGKSFMDILFSDKNVKNHYEIIEPLLMLKKHNILEFNDIVGRFPGSHSDVAKNENNLLKLQLDHQLVINKNYETKLLASEKRIAVLDSELDELKRRVDILIKKLG